MVRRAHLPVLLTYLLEGGEALGDDLGRRDAHVLRVRAAPRKTTESGLRPVDGRACMAGRLHD
jgi:hypothetical protein